jgi:molybdopterin-guanine dinucleotide biosynthesis protein A
MTEKNITGILLAGGQSRRMGNDKGMIGVGGRPLYQYPLKVLGQICDKVLISTCRGSDYQEKYPVLCDEIPGKGPIGGICTCLKKSVTDLNIVLSCDMPMINKELLEYLVEKCTGYDMAVPVHERDITEPLCGVYRKAVADKLEQLISKQVYAVHAVFELVKCNLVTISEALPFYKSCLFMNINDAKDLGHFQTLLDKSL